MPMLLRFLIWHLSSGFALGALTALVIAVSFPHALGHDRAIEPVALFLQIYAFGASLLSAASAPRSRERSIDFVAPSRVSSRLATPSPGSSIFRTGDCSFDADACVAVDILALSRLAQIKEGRRGKPSDHKRLAVTGSGGEGRIGPPPRIS